MWRKLIQAKKTTEKFFDYKSTVYYDENYRLVEDKYPTLYLRHVYILNMLEGKRGRSLDMGCGSGAMLVDLSRRRYETVGFDISPMMIKTADETFLKLEKYKTTLSIADMENLPFVEKSFDLIICSGVIEYLNQDHKSLSEISRVLKPDGVAFVSVTNALTPLWFVETFLKIIRCWGGLYSFFKWGNPFPNARVHVPSSLAAMASRVKLRVIDRAYFHFSPLPFPLDLVFVNTCRSIGLRMERYSKTDLGFLGRGCILKFKKLTS